MVYFRSFFIYKAHRTIRRIKRNKTVSRSNFVKRVHNNSQPCSLVTRKKNSPCGAYRQRSGPCFLHGAVLGDIKGEGNLDHVGDVLWPDLLFSDFVFAVWVESGQLW